MLEAAENPWTDERVALLKSLWTAGLTASQIAEQIGDCTRNAVIGKASRLGLQGRTPLTQERRYRSGPISGAERVRRAAERAEIYAAIKTQRLIDKAIKAQQRNRERRLARAEGREFEPRLKPTKMIETVRPPDFLALTFDELQRDHCRYPRGEGVSLRFCGQPRLAGHSYCKHCYQICYQGPRQPVPLLTREAHQLVSLTAGKPSLQGLTGGESAA
jgi:GcrA cell cycle regulator